MATSNNKKEEKKELESIELDASKYKITNSQYKKKVAPVTRKRRANIYTR